MRLSSSGPARRLMRHVRQAKGRHTEHGFLACVCYTHLLQQTQPLVGRYRDREGGAHHTTPPHPEMTGAQESRDTGAVPLDKGTRWGWSTCTFWSARLVASSCGCSFFPPATPQRTRKGGDTGGYGGYRGGGGHKGVYREGRRGAGQEELNGQVSVDLSRAYKHQA